MSDALIMNLLFCFRSPYSDYVMDLAIDASSSDSFDDSNLSTNLQSNSCYNSHLLTVYHVGRNGQLNKEWI